MSTETKVPSIPSPGQDPDGFMRAIQEIVQVREGARGNPLDRSVTFRDLVDSGLAAPNRAFAGKGRIPASQLITPAGSGSAVGTGIKPTMTVPPRPLGVAAVGTFATVLVTWLAPEYANHAYAEILRSDTNDIGQAVVIGSSVGGQYADSVGEASSKYYWVRFVSTSGVKGSASVGVNGKTALSPEFVMANLLATTWQPNTAYSLFQYVQPTDPNGMLYRVTQEGTSGSTEPEWPTVEGQTKTDGTVRWVAASADERVPFIIGTVNGLPAVVIDTAYIGDATISSAMIKEAFLDNLTAIHGTLNFARIEQGNIFELSVGGEIRSETYSPFNNVGFIIRNNPGRDPLTPTALEYTAEFYGDTLFSGDIRAARIMGGMIVGNVFGIPTDTDNGSYEFIAIRDVVSDVVYGERADSYADVPNCSVYYNGVEYTTFGTNSYADLPGVPSIYYQQPYAGYTISGRWDEPPSASAETSLKKDFFLRNGLPLRSVNTSGNRPAVVKTAPLNIVSCSAVGRNYNRYKSVNVPAMITITRDSAFVESAFIAGSATDSNGIWIGIRGGDNETLLCEVYFGGKKTYIKYPNQPSVEFTNTLSSIVETNLVMPVGGINYRNKQRNLTLSNAYLEIVASLESICVGSTANVTGALPLVRTRLKAGSYILIKSIPFIDSSNVGLCADVRGCGVFLHGGSAHSSKPVGLDIGFAFSSSMDNDA